MAMPKTTEMRGQTWIANEDIVEYMYEFLQEQVALSLGLDPEDDSIDSIRLTGDGIYFDFTAKVFLPDDYT